ncbi:hypothetical protein [Sphingomonas tagetis]|uniref:hypothetical protein n=1 Tax=Sphingomonas tagetis TaxID=2949092 RepID=UPI0020B680AB|nr:hypothetical protein [Sphingomonas tagetis]
MPCLTPWAQAQSYRPDAEGYPCSKRVPLDVAATEQGFVIEPRREPVPAISAARPASVAIGATLKVDRALLDGTLSATEVTDAAPR